MGLSGVVLVVVLSQGGCTKDTDCKGERVCEAGVCVNPAAASAPPVASTVDGGVVVPPPLPPLEPVAEGRRPLPSPGAPASAPASEYPRVVRRDGATCVESLDEQGKVVESCRASGSSSTARRRSRAREDDAGAPEPTAPGGFAFDLTARAGLMLAAAQGTSLALPAFSATLGLGGVGANGVGAMGLLNVDLGSTSGFTLVAATLAPALRLGRTSHVSLALGPSVLAFNSVLGSGSGVVLSALVQGVFQLVGGFSLALNGSAHFDASGVIFFLGAGLGFSTPSG